ncbi:aminotransferase class I/II-fold pyridoxal phosphate-dependent enzyme [Aliidiomarina haloalkalitolerans]|nr:8-amino-7-oxononanoate synthase [Aliidiomarina haloalkalitolerans]
MYKDRLRAHLATKSANAALRCLQVAERQRLDFSSNDYLGLSQQPEIIAAYQQGLQQWGCGSTSSPLVRGYSRPHHELAEYLADWLGYARVLLFSSGFSANSGTLQALQTLKLTPVLDKLAHASLYDAVKPRQFQRFRHNDYAHLEQLCEQLRSNAEEPLVVTESVFSMDGDQVDLRQLAALKARQQHVLMIDDAHALGVLGKDGQGIRGHDDSDCIDILTGTFGKACGLGGAFVAGDQDVIEFLLQECRHYIYSTAFAPAQAVAIQTALKLIRSTPELRQQLQQNVSYWQQGLGSLGLAVADHQQPIQPLLVGRNDDAVTLASRLQAQGIDCIAIRPPTVPVGTARLRISIRANHSIDDIDRLLTSLEHCLQQDSALAEAMYVS